MSKIAAESLVPLDLFEEIFPIQIDLAYKKPAPANIFGILYRPEARLWLCEPLAKVVLLASAYATAKGMKLILYDGLRTTEAQKRMVECPIVSKNPQWLQEPGRLISPPGAGGHPRGMAIDMTIAHHDGTPVDMGTDFDFLSPKSDARSNAAHRQYARMEDHVRENRRILDEAVDSAAMALRTDIVFLPEEWWDFRFDADMIKRHSPLSDADVPPQMRMTDEVPESAGRRDLPEEHFKTMQKRIVTDLEPLIAKIKR